MNDSPQGSEQQESDRSRDIEAHLARSAASVSASADLDDVNRRADRRRRRYRYGALTGVAAVVALGAGAVIVSVEGGESTLRSVSADTGSPTESEIPATVDAADAAPGTEVPTPSDTSAVTEDDDGRQVIDAPSGPVGGFGAASLDDYLAQTTELARRTMPNGVEIQVRRSTAAYGELFGIEWDLPTGSFDECLGGPTLFIGAPDSASDAFAPWMAVQEHSAVGDIIAYDFYDSLGGGEMIITSHRPARSATLVVGGEAVDAADFSNGVAIIESFYSMIDYDHEEEVASTGDDALVVDFVDGSTVRITADGFAQGWNEAPVACLEPPPGASLPPPGSEQPADPAAAEAAVRERHAVLVDQSIPSDERPGDLLTSDEGVAEALEQVQTGGFADSAAGAVYTIESVVFTDATTAWFEYTIVAPTGTFGPRFGQAMYNGEVWQITRETICQDLSLAGGQCDPQYAPDLQPPLPDGIDFDAAMADWEQLSTRYFETLRCNPTNPCGQFDVSSQLPEPGEQPAQADQARDSVISNMESLYGDGALAEHLDLIDDPTGVLEALDSLAEFGSPEAASARAIVEEVVFTSPTAAVFRYVIETDSFVLEGRIGSAMLDDGVWKISRDAICADISYGGGYCDGEPGTNDYPASTEHAE